MVLVKTQGLVLRTTAYSETSVIAKVFTREMGVKSYIFKGVRSSKSRTKQNLLQPLSHLDMTVYNNPKKQIQFVKELHTAHADVGSARPNERQYGNAMRFFIDELLYKTMREEEPNPALFDFTVQRLKDMEDAGVGTGKADFPLVYMVNLTHHLGIRPLNNYSMQEPVFNLKEGRFVAPPSMCAKAQDVNTAYVIELSMSTLLHYYLEGQTPVTTLAQRKQLINILLEYFKIHIVDFKAFHSHEILHDVMQ